jgi:hypothetical protein
MSLSKKDAKIALIWLKSSIPDAQLAKVLDDLRKSPIKNKSFRKSIKKIAKMLERPKKAASKKAA